MSEVCIKHYICALPRFRGWIGEPTDDFLGGWLSSPHPQVRCCFEFLAVVLDCRPRGQGPKAQAFQETTHNTAQTPPIKKQTINKSQQTTYNKQDHDKLVRQEHSNVCTDMFVLFFCTPLLIDISEILRQRVIRHSPPQRCWIAAAMIWPP